MRFLARPLVLMAVCGLALACTACNSNSKKIVGKWKMVSGTNKDGQEQKMEFMGMSFLMEFTADGNIKVGVDTSSMPEELKKMAKDGPDKMNEMKQIGKYKVSGNTIEFKDMEGGGNSPFGNKKQGGKLSFEGDNLTITGDDGSLKLTRVK